VLRQRHFITDEAAYCPTKCGRLRGGDQVADWLEAGDKSEFMLLGFSGLMKSHPHLRTIQIEMNDNFLARISLSGEALDVRLNVRN